MFSRKKATEDRLTVQVHAVSSNTALHMAQKIWSENARTLHLDRAGGKEFLHFAYAQPRCTVWLQRDQGRTEPYELVVRWEDQGMHEVYVITDGNQSGTAEQRLQALLRSVLTMPSIVPSTTAGV